VDGSSVDHVGFIPFIAFEPVEMVRLECRFFSQLRAV